MAEGRRPTRLGVRAGWLALALAVVAPLLLSWWLGGQGALAAIGDFPVSLLALMACIAVLCWNLNAARWRLLLAGRAGRLGQRGALVIEMAAKFALCATPAGTGGAATFLLLLGRRGFSPARASAIYLVDQCCDMLFFALMLALLVATTLVGAIDWPHRTLIGAALLGLGLVLLGLGLTLAWLPRLLRRRPWSAWPGPERRRRIARQLLSGRRTLITTLRLPPAVLAAIFGLCCLHWLLRYSLLYLAVAGILGQDGALADWAWTFLVQMLAMAASQFSVLPGGAGTAELSVGALLLPLMEHDQAAAAVVVWRLVSYHLYLLAGGPVFLAVVGTALRGERSTARRPA
ncbi:lysylphosphatidylglycerol synthase transmembrane domain-containing protein [Halomonas maura]|uniref:lysylphosphatidylglycerol synthase transmembrane domain-containing protein n=1 Tax=Halomonas maura TaxID=117606 RepID=UPI0025B39009|nr:lysylphosphatidylglycerol synthase transmembrane domain-containing protein [Halomonas maura]MDN3556384.1 lysylphosphatidylglycerol synthase transmembrane domain-containing protein [Halomonas maura]